MKLPDMSFLPFDCCPQCGKWLFKYKLLEDNNFEPIEKGRGW